MRRTIALLILSASSLLQAQVSLTTQGTPYTQDFNSLASSGTTNTALPAGWAFVEAGTSALNNTAYSGGTGSSNAGLACCMAALNAFRAASLNASSDESTS